jgi:predicted PurR-regulated permease PerM
MLFAYLLFPVERFLEIRLNFPRIIANLITILLTIGFFSLVIWVIYSQFKLMVDDLPSLKRRMATNIFDLHVFIEKITGFSAIKQKMYLSEGISGLLESGSPSIPKIFSATTGTVVRTALMPVFVFFMLYYRDKAYNFIMMITKKDSQETVKTILQQVSEVTKQYVGGVFLVILILCFLNSFGLYVIGIEYPIFFGIVSAFCCAIPYFGTIIGFFFPMMFSLVTMDSPTYALGVIVLFFIIQFTENNILTPSIVGNNVRLNPFIIVLSLISGAMIWNVAGMLVIVPIVAVFRIICENVDKLKPYAFLLGIEGTEKHAVTIEKIKSLFPWKKNVQTEITPVEKFGDD